MNRAAAALPSFALAVCAVISCGDDSGGAASGPGLDSGSTDVAVGDSLPVVDGGFDTEVELDAPGDAFDGGEAGPLDASPDTTEAGADSGGVDGGSSQGEFLFLTYNVAGLPDFLSSSNPAQNIPVISPLLNAYDLVLVQEDFWYHLQLSSQAAHPYRSDPSVPVPTAMNLGDGLNRYSIFPFGPLSRLTWVACNGLFTDNNDCLTRKGFSVAETIFSNGVVVDIYNLHMDAGGAAGDLDARGQQAVQLVSDIAVRSFGKPVIVAGDTNLKENRPDDLVLLDWILAQTGLQDACRTLSCPVEIHDRVLFRSSAQLALEPLTWDTPDEFVDSQGEDLSDHEPVAVRFRWVSMP